MAQDGLGSERRGTMRASCFVLNGLWSEILWSDVRDAGRDEHFEPGAGAGVNYG